MVENSKHEGSLKSMESGDRLSWDSKETSVPGSEYLIKAGDGVRCEKHWKGKGPNWEGLQMSNRILYLILETIGSHPLELVE